MLEALKHKRWLGGALMVAGTSIGAVTLALPIATAHLGMLGTCFMLTVTWGLMAYTGLCVYEVQSQLPGHVSYLSMAKHTLGLPGQWCSFASYALLLYALLSAYLTGGSDLVLGWLGTTPLPWHTLVTTLVWSACGLVALIAGTGMLDTMNRTMMVGLIATFMTLVFTSMGHWGQAQWIPEPHANIVQAWPILVTAFGYQVIVPSLGRYLQQEASAVPKAILWGSLLPWLIYALWAWVLFSALPLDGPHSLSHLQSSAHPAQHLPHDLAYHWHSHWLPMVASLFVFFAIASSFLGITISLFDLLKDGLQERTPRRWPVAFLTLGPPTLFALGVKNGFMYALQYAGIFVAFLNIILPVWMVFRTRLQQAEAPYRAPGGNWGLGIAGCLGLMLLVIAVLS